MALEAAKSAITKQIESQKKRLEALERLEKLISTVPADPTGISAADKIKAFDAMFAQCRDYFDEVCKNGGYPPDSDAAHYIYEGAMQACLGHKIFDVMNKIDNKIDSKSE